MNSIYLQKSSLIYIHQMEKIPDSYDKCESGFRNMMACSIPYYVKNLKVFDFCG